MGAIISCVHSARRHVRSQLEAITRGLRTVGSILTLALSIFVAPLAADAQLPESIPRLGVVTPTEAAEIEAFRHGLRDLGYTEGQNITIEYRSAEGQSERCPELIAELLRLNVDVLATASVPCALAAKQATQTIPVVIGAMADPWWSGVVASFAQPGGNITGLSLAIDEAFSGKWMELLKEAVPKLSRVAVLWDPTNPGGASQVQGIQIAAQGLGITLQSLEVRDPKELDRAFAAMSRERADALIVPAAPFTFVHRTQIVEFAAKHRLPATYGLREFVAAGGLMAYAASLAHLWRRAAIYVDKILKGAKPGDLPVERATKFELLINLKTAKELGLTIPPTLLILADEVIK